MAEEKEKVDYSLLIMGEEVWRWWSADGGYYTRYRSDLGEHIGELAAESMQYVNFGGYPWDVKTVIPKCLRCKSRKRYRKLLMSIGYPPKIAEFVSSFPGTLREMDNRANDKVRKARASFSYLQCMWLTTFFGHVLTPKFNGYRAEIRNNLAETAPDKES